MSLLGMGSATRKRATDAYGTVARIQEKENQIAAGIENQKRAQEAQTLGTAAGLGSMYGLNKSYGAKKVAGEKLTALNDTFGGMGEFNYAKGGLDFTAKGGEAISGVTDLAGIETVVPDAALQLEIGAEAVAGAEAAVGAEAVVAADVAIAEGAAAASSQGAMATLGAVAAPVGIALGVGFLLNKIFG